MGGYDTGMSVALVSLRLLKEHEKVIPEELLKLMIEILGDGVLKVPIIVDSKHYVILDGHHRYRVIHYLGGKLIPAILVDYDGDLVEVTSWRRGVKVTKKDVLEAALKGRKLPPKTSRHILKVPIPRVDVPLETLGIDCKEIMQKGMLFDVMGRVMAELCGKKLMNDVMNKTYMKNN
jgi:hypothetical protein